MGLQMRLAFMETGDPILRAVDVHNQLRSASAAAKVALFKKLRPLSSHAMQQILDIEQLIERVQKAKAL